MPLSRTPTRRGRAAALPPVPGLDSLPAIAEERPLRLAIVTEYYYPHLGGVCEHVHFFAREARRRGHHVDIVTSRIPGTGERPGVIRLGRSLPVQANDSLARITVGIGLRRQM